ncbi:hypothetical protein Mapa_002966 [Marchantia paleacea]|nr:hypothetical protein Mapa_002966 [Marchantia paleacea]
MTSIVVTFENRFRSRLKFESKALVMEYLKMTHSAIVLVLALVALIFFHVAVGEQPLSLRLLLTSEDPSLNVLDIDRKSFPPGFLFGAASSSYQVEGAVKEGGRGTAVWDTDSHTPGFTADGGNGDVACDSYHKFQEDVDILTHVGFQAYRLSIAWARIFPDGSGTVVNQEGVDYYNRLIDAVIERGIEPWVTLYHWDLPQALEDSFGGWKSREIVPAFETYAETCFALFGDRVKRWITINEPTMFAGTNMGCKAPDHNCGPGNKTENLYLEGHNILLAHAAAVQIYRSKFQAAQHGIIGLVMDIQWWESLSNSKEDLRTHELAMALRYGWFLDPLVYGDYAKILKSFAGSILPVFSAEESQLIRQSFDFLGVNHYTSYYVTDKPTDEFVIASTYFPDSASIYYGNTRNGLRNGPQAGPRWQSIVPSGMKNVLDYVRLNYGNPVVYITENGLGERTDSSVPLSQLLKDTTRIQFYHDYLSYLLLAMRDGARVRGYFAWSLLDSFEWFDGYNVGFGLVAIDRKNMTRYPKASTGWWEGFMRADYVNRGHEQM